MAAGGLSQGTLYFLLSYLFYANIQSFSIIPSSQFSIILIIILFIVVDELKKMVGYKAVDDYVRSGMVVGLGTGSTAYFAVERGPTIRFFCMY